MSGSPDPDRAARPVALLDGWRGLLLRYGDDAHGRESYSQLRADAEAAVACWVWAAEGSQLHRIEPFVRELKALPEPKLLREKPRSLVNTELYGYDKHERIVLVRTYGDSGVMWWEEFLLHAPGEITSIEFTSDPPRRLGIRRWRLGEGKVQELIEAAGSGIEGDAARVSVTRYLYAGERVERVQEEAFDLPSGDRIDWLTIPTYAGDGRVLELRMHENTRCWHKDFVLYRQPPEELPEPAAQRATLARKLTETIAEAVVSSHPPDRLYGLVLAYGASSIDVATAPLFEAARRYTLGQVAKPSPPEAVGDAVGLWDPTWAEPEDYLPEDVDPTPYDGRVMEDAVQHPLDDPEYNLAFDSYERTAAAVDRDGGHRAVNALWMEVAARLTKLDWKGRLDVTDDFVALAYPYDPGEHDIRVALKHSLPPDRYREFEAKGWIPHRGDL